MEEGEGMRQKTRTCNTQTWPTSWRQPEGRRGKGRGEEMGTETDAALGDGRTMPPADDHVLLSGSLGTCTALLTNVIPISSTDFKRG